MSESRSPQTRSRRVIGITGRIGAGKTSVGEHIESKYGFSYVRYSQVLSDWRAQDPESKAHLQVIGWEVMAGGMQMELNRRLIERMQSHSRYVVDGLRHPTDHQCLTKAFSPDYCLLYIESPELARWRRLQVRYPDLESFRAADSYPVEQHIESLRNSALAVVENDASLEALKKKIDTIVQKVLQGEQS